MQRLRRWLPLLFIFAAGAYVRLNSIGTLPPGLYRDEAYYGLDALRVLNGEWHLYFAANNGREGLFIYLLAAGIAVFGRTPEALRITSACVGIATIVTIYFAGRNWFSHRIGVLSAAILAITFWHVAISRVAYRAITLPLVLCLAIALLPNGQWQMPYGKWRTFLAGSAFGLVMYTYTSGQLVLVFLVLWMAYAAWSARKDSVHLKSQVSQLLLPFGIGLVLALAPLLLWLTRHSDLYLARAGQVSILNPAINGGDFWGTLLGNVGKAALMFVWQGDRIWRHNLALRPVFEGALALSFVLGVAVCVWQGQIKKAAGNRQNSLFSPHYLLLTWLFVFLIPTILAEDTPHFLRGIGALPAACMVAAIGLEAGLGWLARRGVFMLFGRAARWISPPAVAAALVLGAAGYKTYNDYFFTYVHAPLTGYWLEQHNVALAQEINTSFAENGPTIVLDRRLAEDNVALQFLVPDLARKPNRWIWANTSNANMSTGLPSHFHLFLDPNHDWSALRTQFPNLITLQVTVGPLAQGDLDAQPRRAFIKISGTRAAQDVAALQQNHFEHGIQLQLRAVALHTHPQVSLSWRATQPIPNDYAVFVHWVRNGHLIAQNDATPGSGYLPMPTWRAGDVVLDAHTLVVPGGAQPTDEIRVGLYDRATGKRLSVLDEGGKIIGDSVIISPPR